jgi:sugar transferase (PEP-CTERM/EpsH1 system associated)
MSIRIMHIVDSLGRGGLENGLVNLIDRLDPSCFEHVVFAIRGLGPNVDRLPCNRVRVACLAKKQTDSSFQVPALARAIREFKPDILHSRNWGAIESVIAGRWVGSCALVHSEHGLESDVNTNEPWRRVCFRRLAFELADRVLTVSDQLRDLHTQRTGFPAQKITVIHNGVDPRRFAANPATRYHVRRELGLLDYEFCVGCVGNLLPVKDHMTLFKAIEGLAESRDNWHLLIIGEGPERPKLEAFVNGHPQWKRRVSLLGSSDRVPELLNAMDVYVLPSVAEGISNSLLEAMASELPVVVTAAGGNPEIVVDGESGLLFPVGESKKLTERLLLLEGRHELRSQLGRQAVRRVRQEFSIDSMVRKYHQLYESLAPTLTVPVRATAGV